MKPINVLECHDCAAGGEMHLDRVAQVYVCTDVPGHVYDAVWGDAEKASEVDVPVGLR